MNEQWQQRNIGEILRLEYGKPLPTSYRNVHGMYPVYGANGEKERSDYYYHDKPSIIVGRKGSAGELALSDGAFWPLDVTYFVVFDEEQYDLRFLYHLLTSLDLPKLARGVKPGINRNDVYALSVKIPPITEQKRIVQTLDEALKGIALARENTEQNVRNARALFESSLQKMFTQGGEGWEKIPLLDLCTVFADGDWIESKDQDLAGVRLIQTGNVGRGVFKDQDGTARYISDATFTKLKCTEVFEGDCLVSRLPDPVGRSCMVPVSTEKMIAAVDCTILRFKPQLLLPRFFLYYSQSPTYFLDIAKLCTGTTRNRISRKNLGATSIPVPSLGEQARIIAKLEELEARTASLEGFYVKKLTALESLTKSLLGQVFSGSPRAA